MNDDELLEALGVEVAPLQSSSRTPREERIIAGFEDILRFHQTHGRVPTHGEDRDIFERLYAVRLDQLRKLPEAKSLLADLDRHGLLSGAASPAANTDELDEDALLAELGVAINDVSAAADDDITVLRHVRSSAEKRAAEEIASRAACADFERFERTFGDFDDYDYYDYWHNDDIDTTRKSRLGGNFGIGHTFGFDAGVRFTMEATFHKTLNGNDSANDDPPNTDFVRLSFGCVF